MMSYLASSSINLPGDIDGGIVGTRAPDPRGCVLGSDLAAGQERKLQRRRPPEQFTVPGHGALRTRREPETHRSQHYCGNHTRLLLHLGFLDACNRSSNLSDVRPGQFLGG